MARVRLIAEVSAPDFMDFSNPMVKIRFENAFRRIGNEAFNYWQRMAASSMGDHTYRQYIHNIGVHYIADETGLDLPVFEVREKFPVMLERGYPTFDLRKSILQGAQRKVVPINKQRSRKNNLDLHRPSYIPPMPTLKNRPYSIQDMKKRLNQGIRSILHTTTGYRSARKARTADVVLRTVTMNSPGWKHPGFAGYHFLERVQTYMENVLVPGVLGEEMDRLFSSRFSR